MSTIYYSILFIISFLKLTSNSYNYQYILSYSIKIDLIFSNTHFYFAKIRMPYKNKQPSMLHIILIIIGLVHVFDDFRNQMESERLSKV